MIINDPVTGFPLGEPESPLLPADFSFNFSNFQDSFSPLILSASGWRKIFTQNGDEESSQPDLTDNDTVLACAMASAWSDFIIQKSGKKNPALYLGTDSRPTGPSIAAAMLRVFISRGLTVNYSFITAAPEIMAAAALKEGIDGFAYISASHNPLGHNGLKFGLSDGGVIGGTDAAALISGFKSLCRDASALNALIKSAARVAPADLKTVFDLVPEVKNETASLYSSFARRVISGLEEISAQNDFFNTLTLMSQEKGIGIVGELNGSARSLSIDKAFLESCGIKYRGINDVPRKIVHRIVPEGFSLNLCREELAKVHKENPHFILGYVPDNDGDRGNIVYYNEKTDSTEILQAQEVFALSVLGELSWLEFLKEKYPDNKSLRGSGGVAVNGPTSLRIDAIASALGAEVFRAETGEANVVNRARLARQAGFIVPILGEGSNGGNITHPAAVRDPLNTIFAILKLLLFPDLFRRWCQVSEQEERFQNQFTLTDIIESLPEFSTTSAFEPRALMKIKSTSHAELKRNYEAVFIQQWEKKKQWLFNRFSITHYQVINYEGTECRAGMGSSFRSGEEKGGLKVEFLDKDFAPRAYLWMRGSGTEPVFRVMADLKGRDPQGETELLEWHTSMIREADGLIK